MAGDLKFGLEKRNVRLVKNRVGVVVGGQAKGRPASKLNMKHEEKCNLWHNIPEY